MFSHQIKLFSKRIFILLLIVSFNLVISNPQVFASPTPDNKVEEVFNKGKNGVVGAFNKVKDKLKGKNKNDSTKSSKEKSKETKATKKNDGFKKKKVSVGYPASNQRFFYTKKHKYKGSDKNEFDLGFSGTVIYDNKTGKVTKQIKIYRNIYGFNKIVIPKGTEILIRTANGKVHKGVTLFTYENESQLSNIGHFSAADNQYHMYGVEQTWEDVEPHYYIDDNAVNDILEYGVIKMRIGNSDMVLEGKEFEKEHKEMNDYLRSIIEEVNKQANYWTQNPPKIQSAPTISEF